MSEGNRRRAFGAALSIVTAAVVGFGLAVPAGGQGMDDPLRDGANGGGARTEDPSAMDPDRRFVDAKTAYDEQDFQRAAALLEPLAQDGHILSQYWLAQVYYLGFGGVERDAAAAARWYGRASQSGLVAAMHKLGTMYMEGEGVGRDPTRAAAWFRQAAERGHRESIVLIGRFYEQGYVYEQDDGQARVWFRRAAQHGSLEAMRRLARNLITSERIPRDYRRAYTWLVISDLMGDRESARLREALRGRFHQDEIDMAEQWARNYLTRGTLPPRLEYDN